MELFVAENCTHCQTLQAELSSAGAYEQYNIQEYEIEGNPENQALYIQRSQELGYTGGGVPLLVNNQRAIEGTGPILDYLENLAVSDETSTTLFDSEQATEISEILGENYEQPSVAKTSGQWDAVGGLGILLAVVLVYYLVVLIKRKFTTKD